jgi:hypothetical protein
MVLVNEPVPVPSEVFESAMVGLAAVPQQTPRAVTADVPSDEISPPEAAVVSVTDVTAVVLTVGGLVSFLQATNDMVAKATIVRKYNCFFIFILI